MPAVTIMQLTKEYDRIATMNVSVDASGSL